jgi:hypothetical protein
MTPTIAATPYVGEINAHTAPSRAVSPKVRMPTSLGGFALETYQHADRESDRDLERNCIWSEASDRVKCQ